MHCSAGIGGVLCECFVGYFSVLNFTCVCHLLGAQESETMQTKHHFQIVNMRKTLLKHIWENTLKISREIRLKASAYNKNHQNCKLCWEEEIVITTIPDRQK